MKAPSALAYIMDGRGNMSLFSTIFPFKPTASNDEKVRFRHSLRTDVLFLDDHVDTRNLGALLVNTTILYDP